MCGTGHALCARRPEQARELLDEAERRFTPVGNGRILAGIIAHLKGITRFHEGSGSDEVLVHLHAALEAFGGDHFLTGRVLDSLGMVHVSLHHLQVAREFFEESLRRKRERGDDEGCAVTLGQLGRLHLSCGEYDEAEECFQQDRELSERAGDKRGAAQMLNHLGQVAAARGETSAARLLLDECLSEAEGKGWEILEGFAYKDRALVNLEARKIAVAWRDAEQARRIFERIGFHEGLSHVNRVRGCLLRGEASFSKAIEVFRAAIDSFMEAEEEVEVARTEMELARTLQVAGLEPEEAVAAWLRALKYAEESRRDSLIREIEEGLRQCDERASCLHLYRRARGRGVRDDHVSLQEGRLEELSVIFFDLEASTEFVRGTEPGAVMRTVNSMMADFGPRLSEHGVLVLQYLGDGFMAIVRGEDHAARAIEAALGIAEVLHEFNAPRGLLDLRTFRGRVGIGSGEVFVGNVGTYEKMDFTAFGTAVNLAARLQPEAEPGIPCVSEATRKLAGDRFCYRSAGPRILELKGFGTEKAWDVAGKQG